EYMNAQRQLIYAARRQSLESEDWQRQIRRMLQDTITAYATAATAEGYVEDWDLDERWQALQSLYGPTMSDESLISRSEYGKPGELSASQLLEAVLAGANAQ